MKKSIDEHALLDKLGAPPGTIKERLDWLFVRASPEKVLEYTKATTDIDPDACSRCYGKKAEGYFENGRFVPEPNRKRLRDRSAQLLNEIAPVCAECGNELYIDAQIRKPRVLILTKTLLTTLATAFYITIAYAIAILMRRTFHWRVSDSILLPLALGLWFYFAALSDIWQPSVRQWSSALYKRKLKRKRDPRAPNAV